MLMKEYFEKVCLSEYYNQFRQDSKDFPRLTHLKIRRMLRMHVHKELTQHWLKSKKFTKEQKYKRILSLNYNTKNMTICYDRNKKYVIDARRSPNPAYIYHRLGKDVKKSTDETSSDEEMYLWGE